MTTSVGQRIRRGLHRRLPILTWLPLYKRARLRPDIVAGVVVAALAVPQSLGYASIAGVPVQVGLYAVPIALLVYAALGSSPQLIVGPVSTVSVLSATLVASMHPASVAQAVTYTSAIALAAGAVLVLAGFLRVGWVAEFLSKPIVTGFVFGLTILVIIGELPNLLGIPVTPGDVLHRISGLALNIDQIEPLTAAVGVSALGRAVHRVSPIAAGAVGAGRPRPWARGLVLARPRRSRRGRRRSGAKRVADAHHPGRAAEPGWSTSRSPGPPSRSSVLPRD